MQLAAQAARAVQLALAGACRDPVLQALEVVRCTPRPDATRLEVRLRPLDAGADTHAIRARLDGAHGLLRAAVAEAIRRRKAPELVLVVET
jgi:ribosome-binding factor A